MRLVRSMLEAWILLPKAQMVDEKSIALVINTYVDTTMSDSGVAQQQVAIRSVFVCVGGGKRGERMEVVVGKGTATISICPQRCFRNCILLGMHRLQGA